MSVHLTPKQRQPFLDRGLTAIGLIAASSCCRGRLCAEHRQPDPGRGWFGIGLILLASLAGLGIQPVGVRRHWRHRGCCAADASGFPNVLAGADHRMIAAAAVGHLVGLVAPRCTGIPSAMIHAAIAEAFFFVEFIRCRTGTAARRIARAPTRVSTPASLGLARIRRPVGCADQFWWLLLRGRRSSAPRNRGAHRSAPFQRDPR